ncbi:MAG: hypothetical protein HY075_03315 [Deltaproteobacteria bacterium]|nr:hypothetical protein [Deltaproteobacteria bacterium]
MSMFLRLFVLIAWLAPAAGWARGGETITVDIAKLRPTQMQIGLAVVRDMVRTLYVDKAIEGDASLAEFRSRGTQLPLKTLSQLNAAQSERLRGRLAELVRTKPPKPLRGARGPDGAIYVTDGHHRAMALALLVLQGSPPLLDPAQARIAVSIEADGDFSGRSRDFVRYIAETGFFTREVRDRHARKELTAEQLVEKLPRTLFELARFDNPTRSAISRVFYDFGMDTEHFVEHLEFLLAEKLTCEIGSLPGYEFDDETLERARRAIFGNPAMVAFLRAKERRGPHGAAAEAALRDALSRYRKLEQERDAKGLHPPARPALCPG